MHIPIKYLLIYISIIKSKMEKYSKIPLKNNLSGREIAEIMLRDHDIHDVKVISVPGQFKQVNE